MKQATLLLMAAVGLTYAATKCYDVVPFRNCVGTQPLGQVGVSQYIRMTLDSVTLASFWGISGT